MNAKGSGSLSSMEALAEACMNDYDEKGWKNPSYHNGDDVSIIEKLEK